MKTFSADMMVVLGLVLMPAGMIVGMLRRSVIQEAEMFPLEVRGVTMYFMRGIPEIFACFFMGLILMGLGCVEKLASGGLPMWPTTLEAFLTIFVGIVGLTALLKLSKWLKLQ